MSENVVNQMPKSKSNAKMAGKTIEETYTKKTQLEHILIRPDTYIGSVEKQTQTMWVFEQAAKQIANRQITFVPGLYKIFDEIMVNAADNKQRDPTMNRIEVTINADENYIRVWNNGNGIPVVIHQEHKIYVPELIFGNLLTGSNFDDNESKTTGGRNGYGAKLANIFSTQFVVETLDSSRGLKYKQVFRDNMSARSNPEITKATGTDYTCITFFPDLKRFRMDSLDEDIVALLSKRVYDIAGTNMSPGAKLSVYLNGSKIEAKNFEQYITLYQGLEQICAFERLNEHWEVGIGVSDGTFQHVSFVNSICTTKGGCHVNYIADQITARLVGVVKKKNKGQEMKPNQIKNHLAVYVNALIVNPAFDSQTKETLTTKSSAFGSTCVVSDKIMKAVEKSGIIDNILSWAKFKQTAELKKKSGSKRSKLLGIVKLDDANHAGTAKSKDCTLILTEGDSAKALAISGLSVVGRDYYGVFPLKGKLLNVREAPHAQILKNEEVQNIVKILGLTFGKEYTDCSSLRYGHLMIMADQDHDGSHIKGLLINFIHHFWPSLLKVPGFMQQFITPIVKCSKGKKEETFFTIPEYHNWKEDHNDGKGWKIKYYKGLGTSTAAEAKEYFSHLDTHEINFEWDANTTDMIEMAFAKKRVDDRKLWLLGMEPGVHIDYNVDSISYDDFVNKELILFSHADNERSIPHFMDGLKPSHRKVLFACFKRNLKQEIKVAQLAGYISEHSAYHHGEASLTQTIVGMAQNYVGSNNINLLSPCGQFGTRLMGGKDAASPRYVFTKLENITRHIFHPHDDALLNYLDDDGQSIEPVCYVPVIPMGLVNGSDGIGTGWSTTVPTYNPREIIANLRNMIAGEEPTEMQPWYRGFTGEINAKTANTFTISGHIEVIDECTVLISELPVGKWTTDYKQMLEGMVMGGPTAAATTKEDGTAAPTSVIIKDFKENHTDACVSFTVTIPADKLAEAMNEKGGLQKKFKLDTALSTTNMNMFDMNGLIRKFESTNEVMLAFYDVRIVYYGKRKNSLMAKLTEEWEKLANKVRFILAVIEGKIVVSNRKKHDLMQDLQRNSFKAFVEKKSSSASSKSSLASEDGDAEAPDDQCDDSDNSVDALDKGYDYLLSMKIWSLTMERVKDLTSQRDVKKAELDVLTAKTSEDLWLEDLDQLEVALDEFEAELDEAKRLELVAQKRSKHNKTAGSGSGSRKAATSRKTTAKPKKSSKNSEDEEDDDDDEDEASDFESEDEGKPKIKARAPAKKAAVVVHKPIGASAKTISTSSTATAKSTASVTSAVGKVTLASTSSSSSAAPPARKKPAVSKVIEIIDSDEEERPLTLLERISGKISSSSAASSRAAVIPAPPAKTKAAAAPKKAPVARKPSKRVVASEDEEEDDEEEEEEDDEEPVPATRAPTVLISRPARAAVVKKTTYAESDEEGLSDEDEDEEFESDDDDDDFEEDDTKFLKKPKASTKPAIKSIAATKVVIPKPAATATAKPSKAAAISTVAAVAGGKGVKRPKKASSSGSSSASPASSSGEVFSPGAPSPKVVKKPRATAATTAAVKKPTAPKKPTVTASATAAASKPKAAPKKPAAASKTVLSDEEEEEEEVEVVVKRTPKPSRQRKPTNYASYYEGEDSEVDMAQSDDDDESSDSD